MSFEEIKNWLDMVIEAINKKINKSELSYISRYCEVESGVDNINLISEGEPVTDYVKGMKIFFIPSSTNTGPVTINIDGIGAVSLRKTPAEEFLAGELMAEIPCTVIHNGTVFIVASGSGGGGDGSYIHPATHPADIIVESAEKQFASQGEKDSWNSKAEGDHTHTEVLARNAVTNTYEVGAAKMKFEQDSLWSYMNIDSEGAILATNKSINLVLDSDNTHTNTHLRVWNGGIGSGHVFSVGEGTDAPIFGPDYHKIFHEGFHPVADKWSAPITLTFAGDAEGTASIDGSGDVTVTLSVAGAGSVNWADIVGKPASTVADIDAAVSEKHTHTSLLADIEDAVGKKHEHTSTLGEIEDAVTKKHSHGNTAVLDALSDDGGTLQYNGSPIEGGGVEEAPLTGKAYNRKDGVWVEDTGGGTPSDLVTTDTVFTVATLAELETLVASGNLGKPRAANTRDIIQWTTTGETIIDKPYDVIFDNVRFIAVNGGTFNIPNTYTGDYAFKFGAGCEFVAEINTPFSKIRYIRSQLGGSDADAPWNLDSVFREIQALDYQGVNVALGKYVYHYENPSENSNSPGIHDPAEVTNGVIAEGQHYIPYPRDGVPKSVVVDLGQLYRIEKLKIWNYWEGDRIFQDKKVWVSEDGVNWLNIYDQNIDGDYGAETSLGKEYPLSGLDPRKDWVISTGVDPIAYSEQSFIVWDEENKCVNFLKSNVTQSVDVGEASITYDTQEEGIKITFK